MNVDGRIWIWIKCMKRQKKWRTADRTWIGLGDIGLITIFHLFVSVLAYIQDLPPTSHYPMLGYFSLTACASPNLSTRNQKSAQHILPSFGTSYIWLSLDIWIYMFGRFGKSCFDFVSRKAHPMITLGFWMISSLSLSDRINKFPYAGKYAV